MNFPCKKCGACCRRVWMLGEDLLMANNLMIKKDGSCENLKEDNSCGIYETRPTVCRINEIGKQHNGTMKNFYIENAKVCNTWMEEDGINEHINIEEIE